YTIIFFFFSSRRRHTRSKRDWSSDVCSSDLDGATSEGDFHEGLNFASVFQTPTIFLNQNNGYAISVPIERKMHSKTIAQKGIARSEERRVGKECRSRWRRDDDRRKDDKRSEK